MREIVTQVNREVWHRRKGAQVELLTLRLPTITVAWDRAHVCCEVAYPVHLMLRQQRSGKRTQIEPPVRRLLETAAIQIEGVDVDVGLHGEPAPDLDCQAYDLALYACAAFPHM